MKQKSRFVATILLLLAAFSLWAPEAHAASATGLPWESSLSTLQESLTGPVAMSLSIIGIVVFG
jgi:type IV secretion system protein VirB2